MLTPFYIHDFSFYFFMIPLKLLYCTCWQLLPPTFFNCRANTRAGSVRLPFSCSTLRQRHALRYGRGRSRCAVKLYIHLRLRLSRRSVLLPSQTSTTPQRSNPLNDASAPLNNDNMPTLRHSYTLTLTDNLPQHKADAQRKNPPHKLVSSLMGLIINPVKVSPSPLLLLLLLSPLSYEGFHSDALSSG